METLLDNIWVHEDTMRLGAIPLRLRMTVIKLSDSSLWIHSPTALTPQLKNEVEQIGKVKYIVGASNGHNLWLQEWQLSFPKATLYVSGKIPQKLKLIDYQLLDGFFYNPWKSDLIHAYMTGVPFFNESVFLHTKTRSLIVTDFIQNHTNNRPSGLAGIIKRFIFEPIGFKGICIAPPLKIGFTIKDKPGFTAFVQKVNAWDFDRIIVTHGDIIEKNAKKIFTQLCKKHLDQQFPKQTTVNQPRKE